MMSRVRTNRTKSALLACLMSVGFFGCGTVEPSELTVATTDGRVFQNGNVPALKNSAADDARLVAQVTELYWALRAPPLGVAAENVIKNHEVSLILAECMKAAGHSYPEFESGPLDGWAVPQVADPLWSAPPSLEAAENGLGIVNEFPAALSESQPVSFDTVPDQAAYDSSLNDCVGSMAIPQIVDWATIESLSASFNTTAMFASSHPAFKGLSEAYSNCMKRKGHAISDPNQIIGVAKQGGMDSKPAAKRNERNLAVADVQCREPIYGRMILLVRDDWSKWIDQNGNAVAAVKAGWSDLIDRARLVSG